MAIGFRSNGILGVLLCLHRGSELVSTRVGIEGISEAVGIMNEGVRGFKS